MEVMSKKRPQENDEAIPVTSIAVCPNCSRISNDLKVCEHCNTLLSEDNSTSFYSSEPKRLRTGSATQSLGFDGSNMSTVENNTAEGDSNQPANTVRPEHLFVNVNNHAVPILLGNVPRPGITGPSQTLSTVLPSPSSVGSLRPRLSGTTRVVSAPALHPETASNFNGNTFPSRSVVGTITRSTADPSGAVLGPNILSQPRLSVNHTEAYISRPVTSSQITLPTYNLQPPPPPFASSVARLPVAVAGTSVPSVVPITGTAPSQNVMVSAVQIRIGSRKFKPVSPVTFKDDGILFTLKDFTYAPVLLNARAIVKCKANLNTFSYPALFLFLEASCMRQIRQIFGLSTNEFAANSSIEIRRCISIFPIFGIEGKQQVQQLTFNIKRSFEAMVKRYPRSSAILEEITNDTVINILLEGASSLDSATGKQDSSGSEAPTTSTSSGQAVVSASSSSSSTNRAINSVAPGLQAPSTSLNVANGIVSSTGDRTSQSSTDAHSIASSLANRVIAHESSVTASSSSTTSAPVLVIPSDSARWQAMQKGLVVGGVYHVLTPDKQRRYCLWNGTQLVPCLVQNTEVTLGCTKIRIGHVSVQCIGQVRIKADGASGVYFTMKYERSGLQEIFLASSDMSSLLVCMSKLSVIFITPSVSGGEKLNSKLKPFMKDPPIDVNGSDLMKQHILIFLPEINHDQEEALKQMKFPSNSSGYSSSLLNVIDHARGLHILASLQINYSMPDVVNENLGKNKLSGAAGFERLAQEIMDSPRTCVGNIDDDDDDVIMTQEELGIKCPYTQKVMEEPVRNIICNHNYEKGAIQEFIVRKKGNAKCPYAGCGNAIPLKMEDLEDNRSLKEYISKMSKSSNQST